MSLDIAMENGGRCVHVKAEDASFRIHLVTLERLAKSFASYILSLSSTLGLTERDPLVLPGVNSRELEAYLCYMFPEYFRSLRLTIDYYEAVFKLATMYGTSTLLLETSLVKSPHIASHARLLNIAAKYRASHLLKRSFHALVSPPLHTKFGSHDLELIPPRLLPDVMSTREAVILLRQKLETPEHECPATCRADNHHADTANSAEEIDCRPFLFRWNLVEQRLARAGTWPSSGSVLCELIHDLEEARGHGLCDDCVEAYQTVCCDVFTEELTVVDKSLTRAYWTVVRS